MHKADKLKHLEIDTLYIKVKVNQLLNYFNNKHKIILSQIPLQFGE